MKRYKAVVYLCKLLSPVVIDKKVLLQIIEDVQEEWELLIEIANKELLIPALYISLKEKTLLEQINDTVLKEYLYEMYKLNKKRNEGILKQLTRLSQTLATENITPILLKGSASLSENHFSDISVRSMMDIDILVPEEKIFHALDILKEDGYEEMYPEVDSEKFDIRNSWHHYGRIYREDETASVELHRWILNVKAHHYFPQNIYATCIKQSLSIENSYVLEPKNELLHSFLHSEVAHAHHRFGVLSLRHLHHFAIMLENYKNVVDFNELEELITQHNLQDIWNEYLYMLNKLFCIEIPVPITMTKNIINYEKRVINELDNRNDISYRIKKFSFRIQNALCFENLKGKYNFNYKYQMLYYLPKRILYLLYMFITDEKKRESYLKV